MNDHKRAIEIFCKFLSIDTTNPPGNTGKAADFLANLCKDAGISWKITGPDSVNQSFLAKIPGRGLKKPVILLNHIDVVPADRSEWTENPFGGDIIDGYIYGRGAIDMKSLGAAEIFALLELAKSGIKPDRDVCFLGCANEETGGVKGAGWLMDNVPELKEADAVINESWPIVTDKSGKVRHIDIAVSEKRYFTVKLTAKGVPSHASIPTDDNPNENIIRALSRISEANKNALPVVTPLMKNYFKTLGKAIDSPFKKEYEDIEKSLSYHSFREEFYKNPVHRALVNNTRTPTVMKAGGKTNVIPSLSEAILDCRLLPGTDEEAFVKEIEDIIDDKKVKVSVLAAWSSSPDSKTDSEVYRKITKTCENHFPGIPVIASMPPFTTDSRYFRAHGINAYGFQPVKVPVEDLNLIHGIDERISVDSFVTCAKMIKDLVFSLSSD